MKKGKMGLREEIDQLRVSALTTKMNIEWATKEIKELNKRVWDEKYLNGEYLVAIDCAIELREIARFKGLDDEVSSWCDSTIAFSEYRDDKNNGWKNNRSWKTAKRGLKTANDPFLRSLLLEPAGLCQAYLVDEQDEPAEPLLVECVAKAEASRDDGRIGEATNAFRSFVNVKETV